MVHLKPLPSSFPFFFLLLFLFSLAVAAAPPPFGCGGCAATVWLWRLRRQPLAVAAAPPPFGWLWLAALPPSSPATAPPSLGGGVAATLGWLWLAAAPPSFHSIQVSALIGSRCCFHCTCPPFAAFQEVPILVELGPVSHKALVMIFRSGSSKYNAPMCFKVTTRTSLDRYLYIHIHKHGKANLFKTI